MRKTVLNVMFGMGVVSLCASHVVAQPITADNFRQISTDEIHKMGGYTFAIRHNLDRMYLSQDGTFIQQINEGWNDYAPGALLQGRWEAKRNNLCWQYNQETQTQYALDNSEYCFAVTTNSPAEDFMGSHIDAFRLYSSDNKGGHSILAFNWNQNTAGNYIFDPEYVPYIKEKFGLMSSLRRDGTGMVGIVEPDKISDATKKYYETFVDRIFTVRNQNLLFNRHGYYFFITDDYVEASAADPNLFRFYGRHGRWFIKDDVHCWIVANKRAGACEFVLPEGKGLIRPYEGMMGVFFTGLARVYGEQSSGHKDIGNTKNPVMFREMLNEKPTL